jgi:hypothetical protein
MKVRILDEAEVELLEAMQYYEDCRTGLGLDFYDRVNEAMLTIGREPLRFPLYEGKRRLRREFRRTRVDKFPYFVVFEVLEDEVLVVAVAHTSRRPAYWEDRA